eukprot:TRINITY_DN2944_c0_g1_i1.p1 TRINITY_DN2944_c0_g1~~TRINITY_DN2944_c0_g1_i1.p1  ORF type:complete len:191 (+),score=48.26 TRINITY_DN2944_c0_g1_i1:61-633(+)
MGAEQYVPAPPEQKDIRETKGRRRRINRSNKLVVSFDPDARREYLTGFHKRKLQRKEQAKKEAEEMLRKARIQSRKEKRAARDKKLEKVPQLPAVFHEGLEEGTSATSNFDTTKASVTVKVTPLELATAPDVDEHSQPRRKQAKRADPRQAKKVAKAQSFIDKRKSITNRRKQSKSHTKSKPSEKGKSKV